MSTLALLTDFGLTDSYVGVMKGVIRSIAPDAHLIDISHAVQPQNIRQGAFMLLNAYLYFPANTVFLAVVDPGVGGQRRPIGVRAGAYTFIAPDNGLLSYVLAASPAEAIIELNNPAFWLSDVSASFHGRDLFAPVAAHLAAGATLSEMGTPLETLVQLPIPKLKRVDQVLTAEVLHIDHFGNIVTSIGFLTWESSQVLTLKPRFDPSAGALEIDAAHAVVTLNKTEIRTLRSTYSLTQPGDLLAMVGSSGHLEIAVNQGNAAARLGTKIGDLVELRIS